MQPFWQWLAEVDAQNDVVEWARPYEADLPKLWRECPRGDWLLAIAARLGAERNALVSAACRCARLSLAHLPEDEGRPEDGLEAAEAWSTGEGDAEACGEHKDAISQALDEAADPATGAAIIASMSALDAIDDPDAAANAASFAIQAAVLDAGDCAMMEAMRFAQRRSAQLVREAISADDIDALWPQERA
ncbi:MAG: hypothetical protein OXT09_36490 [Myxococcales bacterium]|nr:hypothetical protein [Myxococcales bacterium]